MEQSNNSTINTGIFKRKWIFIVGVLALLVFLLALIMINAGSNQITSEQQQPTISHQNNTSSPSSNQSDPMESAAMQAAVNEAKQSAAEYDNNQTYLRTTYPWLRRLPLVGAENNYFAYFDLDKKIFICRLYPKPTDNIDQMKTLIMQQLKAKEIPTADFTYQWLINPK